MTKRVLRSFLYLDENIVDDYLAQFEGGVLEGPYTTQDTTTGIKGGGAGIKAWAIEGNANVSSSASSVVAQTIRETPVAKFTRLYDLLAKDEIIQPLNGFDTAVYEQIEPGEIVEVRGSAKLPQWEHVAKTISDFSSLIDIMKAIGQDPLANGDANDTYQAFTALIAKKVQEGIELIIAPIGSPQFKFVANLNRTKISREIDELEAEVTVLGKVRRKLAERETIDIFRLAPRMDQLEKFNRAQRRSMSKGKSKIVSTDSPFDEVIKYPAMQIQPIAIYQ